MSDHHFVARSVEPPSHPSQRTHAYCWPRRPFTEADERRPPARAPHRRTSDQGQRGAATAAKLTAARELALPVVVVRRPRRRGARTWCPTCRRFWSGWSGWSGWGLSGPP
ncbi:hypothetical protein LV779_27355 [Streptomyces thinghirensis]|nr:hypothetical protein [Streptomyces thinghirensis]